VINRALIKSERSLNSCTPRTPFGQRCAIRKAPPKQDRRPQSNEPRLLLAIDPADGPGDLVALTWFVRGDDDLESWHDLRAEALQAHNNRTAQYLLATPMLADYLEEALSQLGKSFV
jgi:hypothetical protein